MCSAKLALAKTYIRDTDINRVCGLTRDLCAAMYVCRYKEQDFKRSERTLLEYWTFSITLVCLYPLWGLGASLFYAYWVWEDWFGKLWKYWLVVTVYTNFFLLLALPCVLMAGVVLAIVSLLI